MAVRDAFGKFASLDWTPSTVEDEMVWHVVNSSNVASVGYNAGRQILGVTFLNGSAYEYMAVPENVFEALWTAGSVGKALHAMVKGHYSYQKVA